MNKMIVICAVGFISGCSAIANQPTRSPFVQIQDDSYKINSLKEDQNKNWDRIIDQAYAATSLDVLDELSKRADTIKDTNYIQYGKVRLALMYQRAKLTYWSKQ